jgi:hypothetical protein
VEPVSRLKTDKSRPPTILQSETFNIQPPASNIQVADAGKDGSSALNVECSMVAREISRRATIWTGSRATAGIPASPAATI